MAEHAPALMCQPRGRLLTIEEVTRDISVHRATIYRWVDAGRFPRPLRLSPRRVAWAERDLEDWKQRIADTPGY